MRLLALLLFQLWMSGPTGDHRGPASGNCCWESYSGTTPEQFCYQVRTVIDGKK